MKKKIVITIIILLIIIIIKLFLNFFINWIFLLKYNKEVYSQIEPNILENVCVMQRYVALYNHGNILYEKGEYENAIEKYKEALNSFIPKNKECSVRINYALAICKMVNVDEKNQSSIKAAIDEYERAIDILIENDCANTNGTGHSEKAEILKDDIQKEIDRLKKLLNDDSKEDDDEKDKEKDKDKDKTQEKKEKELEKKLEEIEEKMQEIKQEAVKKQKEQEELDFSSLTKEFTNRKRNW